MKYLLLIIINFVYASEAFITLFEGEVKVNGALISEKTKVSEKDIIEVSSHDNSYALINFKGGKLRVLIKQGIFKIDKIDNENIFLSLDRIDMFFYVKPEDERYSKSILSIKDRDFMHVMHGGYIQFTNIDPEAVLSVYEGVVYSSCPWGKLKVMGQESVIMESKNHIPKLIKMGESQKKFMQESFYQMGYKI